MMPSAQDDFRALSVVDQHHKTLGGVTDRWFARTGHTFLSVRVGDAPLVAVALSHPAPPAAPTA